MKPLHLFLLLTFVLFFVGFALVGSSFLRGQPELPRRARPNRNGLDTYGGFRDHPPQGGSRQVSLALHCGPVCDKNQAAAPPGIDSDSSCRDNHCLDRLLTGLR